MPHIVEKYTWWSNFSKFQSRQAFIWWCNRSQAQIFGVSVESVDVCWSCVRFLEGRSSRHFRTFSRRSCGNGPFFSQYHRSARILHILAAVQSFVYHIEVVECSNSLVLAPFSLGQVPRRVAEMDQDGIVATEAASPQQLKEL